MDRTQRLLALQLLHLAQLLPVMAQGLPLKTPHPSRRWGALQRGAVLSKSSRQ